MNPKDVYLPRNLTNDNVCALFLAGLHFLFVVVPGYHNMLTMHNMLTTTCLITLNVLMMLNYVAQKSEEHLDVN